MFAYYGTFGGIFGTISSVIGSVCETVCCMCGDTLHRDRPNSGVLLAFSSLLANALRPAVSHNTETKGLKHSCIDILLDVL